MSRSGRPLGPAPRPSGSCWSTVVHSQRPMDRRTTSVGHLAGTGPAGPARSHSHNGPDQRETETKDCLNCHFDVGTGIPAGSLFCNK